jgi:pilus assembly protein CpaC
MKTTNPTNGNAMPTSPLHSVLLAVTLLVSCAASAAVATPSAVQPDQTAVPARAVCIAPLSSASGAKQEAACPLRPARAIIPTVRTAEVSYLPTESLTVVLGEIKLLPTDGKVTRVAVGNGAVLSTTTVDTKLLLIAETLGETTLMVWSGGSVATYQVRVVSKATSTARQKIDSLIGDNQGISVKDVGDDLVLSGVAHREHLAKLNKVLAQMPNVINNITEDQGSAFTRSVLFRLNFVEVNRSLLEQVGIAWSHDANGPVVGAHWVGKQTGVYTPVPPGGAGDLLAPVPNFITRNGTTGGLFLGLATTITSRLNLRANDGDMRVLATPELTAKSGGKAKLQVGGEVPIPMAGAFGATTVEFKPYGIMFTVEPQIDANNVITAKLSTELSQIDPSVSVQGIPGFITRNTSTEISIKPGEIVALSGLINSELAKSVDKVPGLGNIPIIGSLFRSNDFRRKKTELIVFLEAEVIEAGDGLAGKLRDRGLAAAHEVEQKFKQEREIREDRGNK